MEEERQEEIVRRFRQILNDFKSPYLLRLEDDDANEGAEQIQNTERLETALQYIDRLYLIVKRLIDEPTTAFSKELSVDAAAVATVLENRQIFDAIRLEPSLKSKLHYYLTLDLRTYPFTFTTKHVAQLDDDNVPSFHHQIISNQE